MTTCRQSISLLLEYLDGGMPEDLRARLDEHFGGCQPCEEFLRTYRATPSLCKKALAVKEMPTEVASRLTDFLRKEIRKKSAP
jgi:anti-sigma factor RsiW